MMKTNSALQIVVQDAIQWEPLLNVAEIGVTARVGVASFTVVVGSNAKKLEAAHCLENTWYWVYKKRIDG